MRHLKVTYRKHFHRDNSQILEPVAQRSHAITNPGGFQGLTAQSPEQPGWNSVPTLLWAGGWTMQLPEGFFYPNYSIFLDSWGNQSGNHSRKSHLLKFALYYQNVSHSPMLQSVVLKEKISVLYPLPISFQYLWVLLVNSNKTASQV